MTSDDGLTDLSKDLPTNQVRLVAGGSHMLLLEQPKEVAAAIREFLRAQLPADATGARAVG